MTEYIVLLNSAFSKLAGRPRVFATLIMSDLLCYAISDLADVEHIQRELFMCTVTVV